MDWVPEFQNPGRLWTLALLPVLIIVFLRFGIATPTESAALTAGYAILTQTLFHREMKWRGLAGTLVNCAEVIGGIMLGLGRALGQPLQGHAPHAQLPLGHFKAAHRLSSVDGQTCHWGCGARARPPTPPPWAPCKRAPAA